MNNITQIISQNIEETCSVTPTLTLTNRASQQGGYLPKKTQKIWKQHITTYHLIRKTIYITKNLPNWRTHPIMNTLGQYSRIHIPSPPEDETLINIWIKEIAVIAKTINLQARKITTKYTKECIKKAISKYRKLYETNPKRINRKIFKNLESLPLDCITDRNNNILTNPKDIANEIHIQQTLSKKLAVSTCYYLSKHPLNARAQLDNIHGTT